MRYHAAVAIQCWWRRVAARRRYGALARYRQSVRADDLRWEAASAIQGAWRRRMASYTASARRDSRQRRRLASEEAVRAVMARVLQRFFVTRVRRPPGGGP